MPARSTPSVRFHRHVLLPVVAGLLAAVLFVACETLPTDPAMEADRPIVGAERFDGRASATALPAGMQVTSGTTSFMCVLSTRTDAASAGAMGPAYIYRYVGLAFDETFAESAAGAVVTLTYRLRDERGQITRQATCRLPENLQAQALLSAWLFPQGSVGQGERLQFVRENMPGLFTTWDDLFGEPCTSPCDEGQDCVWTPCDDLPDGLFCYTGGICYPVDGGNDEEENEPIDIPGGGGGGCSPFDCPPDAPGDGDDDLPPAGVPPPPPPSDDCPEDDDDTPAPPEGGDDPCGLDCWDPPEHDDPFDPPGFMSVQSWQTTSSGMAVAVYQPASADCPGDDEPPPCEETDFGDTELQEIMESLDEQGILQELMDDSNATSDQGERREQGGWIVQNDDGTIDLVRYHDVPGADIEYFYTRIRGVKLSQKPENTIGMIHTHPFSHGETLYRESVIEEYIPAAEIEKRGGMEYVIENEIFGAQTEPSIGDKIVADILSNLYHIMIDRVSVNIYEAEGWNSETKEFDYENHEHFDKCGFNAFIPN